MHCQRCSILNGVALEPDARTCRKTIAALVPGPIITGFRRRRELHQAVEDRAVLQWTRRAHARTAQCPMKKAMPPRQPPIEIEELTDAAIAAVLNKTA